MFDIILSTRDNIEWISIYLDSYKKYTKFINNYNLIILDSSIENNYLKLIDIIKNYYDLNITVVRFDRHTHFHDIWLQGISLSNKRYVLVTHSDIVYLMPNWDIFLLNKIHDGYSLVSVSVREKIYPESVWICCEKEIFLESKFDQYIYEDRSIEHGNIKYVYNKNTTNKEFYINQLTNLNNKYGDIAILDGKEFIYHNYYSTRIQKDSLCPVPEGVETIYLHNRESFDKTIEKIRQYLILDKNDISLAEYLLNYNQFTK